MSRPAGYPDADFRLPADDGAVTGSTRLWAWNADVGETLPVPRVVFFISRSPLLRALPGPS